MVRAFLAIMVLAGSVDAATLRFFGSAGAESQVAPRNDDSPLNEGLDFPSLTNVADVTTFVEAISDDRRWKGRLKLRADTSDRSPDTLRAGEAFLQVRVAPWLDVKAGRVIEKWGTGYGWTPTAFAGPAKNPTDPDDRRSAYSGVDMVRADVFVTGTTVSLYTIEGGSTAARLNRMFGATDVSLSFRHDDDVMREGVSFSRVIGDALEIHAEVARTRERSADDVVKVVIGGQYTFANETNLVVEMYHGGDGLTTDEWNAFRDSVSAGVRNSSYVPLRMARTYGFIRFWRPLADRKVELELIAITSLRDGSSIFRTTITRKLPANLRAYLIHTEFAGHDESEMDYVQVSRMTTAGVRLHF